MKLYRAVSPAELDDLRANGLRLRSGPNAIDAKWFADELDAAEEWALRWEQWDGIEYRIIEVEVPDAVAATFYRVTNLDQIGDARCAPADAYPQITFVRMVR